MDDGGPRARSRAGSATVTGIWIGTASLHGAAIHALSTILFWCVTRRARMWGLVPMQIGLAALRALRLTLA